MIWGSGGNCPLFTWGITKMKRKLQTWELGLSPAELAYSHAGDHRAAVERYNARPPDPCPYRKGTAEYEAYDKAWWEAMRNVKA
jgi:hypothetical protein